MTSIAGVEADICRGEGGDEGGNSDQKNARENLYHTVD